MSIKVSVVSMALAVGALTASMAFAQSGSSGSSRADVKAQTRAAQKAGELPAAGEGLRRVDPQARSSKTRQERKGEALAAGKAGEFKRAGIEPEWKEARELARTPSTTTRADRKSNTRAAAQAGQLTPAGEASEARRR
jgi:hypothetical protein